MFAATRVPSGLSSTHPAGLRGPRIIRITVPSLGSHCVMTPSKSRVTATSAARLQSSSQTDTPRPRSVTSCSPVRGVQDRGVVGSAGLDVLRRDQPVTVRAVVEAVEAREPDGDPLAVDRLVERELRFGNHGAVDRPGGVHRRHREQHAALGVDREVRARRGRELPRRDLDAVREPNLYCADVRVHRKRSERRMAA